MHHVIHELDRNPELRRRSPVCIGTYGNPESEWSQLALVAVPACLPWVLAAIRTTAPRAFLGMMIAEWLATGRGLDNLMNQSRGSMELSMIWNVAVVSALLSVAFYQVAQLAEVWFARLSGLK